MRKRIQVDQSAKTSKTTKAAKQEAPSFRQRLAGLRKAAGLTQIELAAEPWVSRRMVAYYESPAATPPANLLPQIAATLGGGDRRSVRRGRQAAAGHAGRRQPLASAAADHREAGGGREVPGASGHRCGHRCSHRTRAVESQG